MIKGPGYLLPPVGELIDFLDKQSGGVQMAKVSNRAGW